MDIYTTNAYIRDTFGEKLYKISLNAGTTCPNRDGKAGTGGCIFAVPVAPEISLRMQT